MASSWSKFTTYISHHGGLFLGTLDDDAPYTKMFHKLISEDEAKLGMYVKKKPQSAEDIAKDAKIPADKAAAMLKHMSQKGVIFEREAAGKFYYNITPFIPGFYEYVMTDPETKKDPEMAAWFRDIKANGSMMRFFSGQDGGLLKVTPVMKEVHTQKKAYSFEDAMTFVNKAQSFAVTDCACRLSAKLVGKGCDHPVEDTCLQFDDTADYYVRTGRGRRITKEEAVEILKKTEEAGLVHTAFSVEGEDYSSFICNCCGCSCSGLRFLNTFDGNPFSRSNFRANINEDNCVACGECVNICPVNAVTLGTNFADTVSEQLPEYIQAKDTPFKKMEENWDYINERRTVAMQGTAPCKTACPAHISVQGYIRKAAEGKFDEALEVIKRDNPLPAVCGRICPHPCESACTRGSVDAPVAIDAIKMYIADLEREEENRYIPEKKGNYSDKVAVIGSGPAGLTCAYYLAVYGYQVTIFEKEDIAGGMLTLGIPSYVLEKEVIESEIDVIKALGVEIKCGVEVGKDVTISDLRKEGYKAFYIAIGAQEGSKAMVPGEDLENVMSGVDYLKSVNLGKDMACTGKVVVVGGGNVAIDVARTAVREGAKSVDMFCLESEEEMPAALNEQLEAKEEGIAIHNGWGPLSINGNGAVSSVVFKRCTSVRDENGLFAPKYDENDLFETEADMVLLAIGQRIDWGDIAKDEGLELGRANRINVDEISFQSSVSDIFAGGDVVTGPKFAIDAIAMGKQGAISIYRQLQNIHLTDGRHGTYQMIDKSGIHIGEYDSIPRQQAKAVDTEAAKKTFKDLREGLTQEQIYKETQRCLKCGRSVVDTDKCIGCGVCTVRCSFDAIHLKRVSDSTPANTFPAWYGRIITYNVKRAARLAFKGSKKQPAGKEE